MTQSSCTGWIILLEHAPANIPGHVTLLFRVCCKGSPSPALCCVSTQHPATLRGKAPHQAGGAVGAQGHLSAASSPSASSMALVSMLASQAALVSAIWASMSRFNPSTCMQGRVEPSLESTRHKEEAMACKVHMWQRWRYRAVDCSPLSGVPPGQA